jgi:hypothetical protein
MAKKPAQAGLSDIIRSAMAAVRGAPAAAPKASPGYLTPRPQAQYINPRTGSTIPVRDPVTGRMGPAPREFTPGQRVAGAATLGAGAAAIPTVPALVSVGAQNARNEAPPFPSNTATIREEEFTSIPAGDLRRQAMLDEANRRIEDYRQRTLWPEERRPSLQRVMQADALRQSVIPEHRIRGSAEAEATRENIENYGRARNPKSYQGPNIENLNGDVRPSQYGSYYGYNDPTNVSEFSRFDYVPGQAAPARPSAPPSAPSSVAPSRPSLPPELQGDQFSEIAGYTGASPTVVGEARPQGPISTTPIGATELARQVVSGGGGGGGSHPPVPPTRTDRPSGGGFFSGLFSDPYAGKSSRDLYYQAQDMQRGGDEYGANLLTQRAMSMDRGGEKARGGSAGAGMGGKDAALHKALEIIHHMLTSRR